MWSSSDFIKGASELESQGTYVLILLEILKKPKSAKFTLRKFMSSVQRQHIPAHEKMALTLIINDSGFSLHVVQWFICFSLYIYTLYNIYYISYHLSY